MKSITINKLQNDISKVIKEVSEGEVYEIMRYSESQAFLISREHYEQLQSGQNCKACVDDLRKITKKLKN